MYSELQTRIWHAFMILTKVILGIFWATLETHTWELLPNLLELTRNDPLFILHIFVVHTWKFTLLIEVSPPESCGTGWDITLFTVILGHKVPCAPCWDETLVKTNNVINRYLHPAQIISCQYNSVDRKIQWPSVNVAIIVIYPIVQSNYQCMDWLIIG